ncbi:MAG: IS91 family transposase ISAzo26 [bacterium]|nr:IS91 family transposase ISAzo26 [bacterium]
MSSPPEASTANGLEVADIFRCYGEAYRAAYHPPLVHLKVMSAIERCRTEALGGHLDECEACGYQHPFYNSCRNRHCPKCGALAKERWLSARQGELLAASYFHVVMTLPDTLNAMVLVNPTVLYNILFQAGSETLLELGKDPKHLGGEIGVLAVLHTWGQNLLAHPHLHCIVTGGGLSEDGKRWVLPKKAKKKNGRRRKFFVHVNVISDLFKKKFLAYLQGAYDAGGLKFVGKTAALKSPGAFKKFKTGLYAKNWVTYCKAPFGGPRQVLSYLARYTHRVAISNDRLVSLNDGVVTFRWRDYRNGQQKLMKVDALEFIRRFLLHVLPKRFHKIRYYGIWHRRKRPLLKRCQEILGATTPPQTQAKPSWEELVFALTGKDPHLCPKCGNGRMVTKELLPLPRVMPASATPPIVVHSPP